MAVVTASLAALAIVALVALWQERRARLDAERAKAAAHYALGVLSGQLADAQAACLPQLAAEWDALGLEFESDEEAAHALADYLANRTGNPILAVQQNGPGLIVAIPDEEEPGA